MAAAAFDAMWAELAEVGRDDATGGYDRFCWQPAELTCREWFIAQAQRRGLATETDRNGNLWAWTAPGSDRPAVVTGSHLDSVPSGGAFDGPLGIATAFAALDELHARGVEPAAPVAVVAFAEEEGGRFGLPCLGSRLLTGVLAPARAAGLRDREGHTFGQAMRWAGFDPSGLGSDPERLARIGTYVELHVEQGRALVHGEHPVGVGSGLRPHGRWRLDLLGRADHAGTALLADRCDPMPVFAATVLAVRAAALRHGALATVGRCLVDPGGTNVIPRQVSVWLDIRAGESGAVRAVLEDVLAETRSYARADGVAVSLAEESYSPAVTLDLDLAVRLSDALDGAPVLDTGAGHDAGVLAAAGVPTAMLFVRNPTGVSHAPDEHATAEDCHAGVAALADALLLAAENL
ncbi:MAG: allantoate amidohydrolase [Sporichthyaceae bacterium]